MSFGFGNNSNSAGFGSSTPGASGFGGFGSNNNNNNTTTSGSLFGGNTATSGSGAFGGSTSSLTTSNTTGAKPAAGGFGAPATTSSGGLFGNNNTSTSGGFGGGGFGNNNASTGFGASNTGGGMFGATKPATTAFGSNSTSLFGGGNNATSGGFGATSTTSNPFGANTSNNNTAGGFGATSTTGGFGGGAFSGSTSAPMSNQGSAAVPFQAFTEKDGPTNGTSSYQSLAFQEPYKNQSFEELRTQDYVQGRRYGNTNGQAGSFGASTGFGGFGTSNTNTSASGGLFGNNNPTATAGTSGFGGFGANNTANNTAGGFGSTANNGGLFGAKPAGSLFGGGAPTSGVTTGAFGGTSGSAGGLFGNTNNNANATTGFGATNPNASGGLFGNANNNNGAGGAFGTNNSTAGGLFGNNQPKPATGNLFGAANNTSTGGNLFGTSTTNNNNTGGFGTNNNTAGAGLFGNNNNASSNQPKPAFGFGGNTNTGSGGGLFGNANNAGNANPGGGLFGNPASNNTGGGLFGAANTQHKPVGGGLFGTSTTNTNTGGGLFNNSSTGGLFGTGNNNASNNNTTPSLFGGNNNNNQIRPAGGSLFGQNTNTTNNNSGGLSLFGNNNSAQNQNNAGNSLFGSQNNQNGNSLFGNSQAGQQGGQLYAGLTSAPYGNEQLFASLTGPAPPLGPLATPLANSRATPKRTQSLLESVRMNTPVYTPRGSSLGRNNTYGFNHSAYGTPGSAYSMSLTPGANSMLKASGSLSSGVSGRLTKSMSTNDLRDGSSSQGSLLRPSMLNPGGSRAYGSGSMRKLNIDRSLREDFFGTPKLSETPQPAEERDPGRRVVFDSSADKTKASTAKPSAANALVRTETEGTDDVSPPTNSVKRSEMEQVKSSSLGTTSSEGAPRQPKAPSSKHGEPGAYSTKPPVEHLKKMSRQQLQKMGGLTVARENVGKIEFGPCDLSSVLLDQICGDIVKLEPRAATVYPDNATKPPMGRGLNVPATIHLEKSWPRNRATRHKAGDTTSEGYRNHVHNLKKIGDTKFISYDTNTGVWKFSVDHFTTYGLDDDDDELPHEAETSGLSDAPDTSQQEGENTLQSIETGDVDDTFEFKLDHRQSQPPGGYGISFDYDDLSADEQMVDDQEFIMPSGGIDQSQDDDDLTSSGGPVQTVSPSAFARHQALSEVDLLVEDATDPDMPGSFVEEPKIPRSILKPSMGFSTFASPKKLATEAWEEQLLRTLSPKKRDRQALQNMQQSLLKANEQDDVLDSPFKQSMLGQSVLNQSYLAQKSAKKGKLGASMVGGDKSAAFRTSMDIMNSLWETDKVVKKAGAGAKGFEYPYAKKSRHSTSEDLTEQDIAFHDTMKPTFATNGVLVYSAPGSQRPVFGKMRPALRSLVGEHKDVRFAKFVPAKNLIAPALEAQHDQSQIDAERLQMPMACTPETDFAVFANRGRTAAAESTLAKQEHSIWQLCSTLFDDIDVAGSQFVTGVAEGLIESLAPRVRLDVFSTFWAKLVAPDVLAGVQRAKTGEEKALLHLTGNNVVAACEALTAGNNFKLAMMVSQLSGTREGGRRIMATQIQGWRDRKDWSEMSDAVRAVFSILAGETCIVQGQAGPAEDKTSEFCISRRFKLTWQQSLGLRVFYGGQGTLADAIRAYTADLDSDRETVCPTTLWDTVDNADDTDVFADKEDTLMSLLRLYIDDADATELFDAMTVSGSALNSRIAWQMGILFQAKSICNLPESTIDDLTLSFAAELESAQNIVIAAWVLLHLQNTETRAVAIKALLERNAEHVPTPDADTDVVEDEVRTFLILTEDLRIPAHLIYAARAPLAKSLADEARQVYYLLRAAQSQPSSDYDVEAQEIICATVGPDAVISKDYKELRQLLPLFTSKPSRLVHGWASGAGVYNDFLRVVSLNGAQRRGREGESAVRALRKGIASLEDLTAGTVTLRQRVAVQEMSRVCDEMAREAAGYAPAARDGDVEMDGSVGSAMIGVDGGLAGYRRAMGVVV